MLMFISLWNKASQQNWIKQTKQFCTHEINNSQVGMEKCQYNKQPYIFLFPKFLELFFTPKNTPPKLRNSKMSLKVVFFCDTLHT